MQIARLLFNGSVQTIAKQPPYPRTCERLTDTKASANDSRWCDLGHGSDSTMLVVGAYAVGSPFTAAEQGVVL